jgi:hypothetical protein
MHRTPECYAARMHFIPAACSVEELPGGGLRLRLTATTGECVSVVIHDAAKQRHARKMAQQFNPLPGPGYRGSWPLWVLPRYR